MYPAVAGNVYPESLGSSRLESFQYFYTPVQLIPDSRVGFQSLMEYESSVLQRLLDLF